MAEVHGHLQTRSRLRNHQGSFALLGPSGVGRQGVVSERLEGTPHQDLDLDHLDEALQRRDLVHVIHDRPHFDWTRLLRPLEEERISVAIIANDLPAPVRSRVPVFRVGYLAEEEVVQVLAQALPMVQPRTEVAKACQGTLEGVEEVQQAVESLPRFRKDLLTGTVAIHQYPSPLVVLRCFSILARSVLRLPSPVFPDEVRSLISPQQAQSVLRHARTDPSPEEARNFLRMVFEVVRG